jgi:GDP-L-fucose synthase
MHVDDMASACVHLMELPKEVLDRQTEAARSHINVGTGKDCTIRELAETLSEVTGFNGKLVFDTTKPDGAPRKLLDISRLITLGWTPGIRLRDGLRSASDWFVENQSGFRR